MYFKVLSLVNDTALALKIWIAVELIHRDSYYASGNLLQERHIDSIHLSEEFKDNLISENRLRMNNIKIWQILLILLPLAQSAYSQQNNYIESDSMLFSGADLVHGSPAENAQFIVVKSKDAETKYYPDQLRGYGFKNGPVYRSRNITVAGQSRRVFLEEIRAGKITLYYYFEKGLKRFFLEKDSTVFVELPDSDEFRTRIIEHTGDFEWIVNQVQLARYNRQSLAKLISLYNDGKPRHLPYPRFGLTAGYSMMSLTVPETIFTGQSSSLSFAPGSSVQLGIFADLPVSMSNFSLNTGVNFSKHGFSANSVDEESDVDIVVNIISANVPVLIRYTVPALVWRPFVNAGGICSFHLKYERDIYKSELRQDIIIINEPVHQPPSERATLGYSVGAGLQYNLNVRNIASLELRYSQLPGKSGESDMSFTEVFVSYSF